MSHVHVNSGVERRQAPGSNLADGCFRYFVCAGGRRQGRDGECERGGAGRAGDRRAGRAEDPADGAPQQKHRAQAVGRDRDARAFGRREVAQSTLRRRGEIRRVR